MTTTPYPISGHVYGRNGSTAVSGATVTLYNVTQGKWLPGDSVATTNSSGEYSIDPANIVGGYENSDAIQIIAWNSELTYSMNYRHTIDTDTGSLEKDLVLHIGEPINGTAQLIAAVATNNTAGGLYVHLYDRENDHVRITIEVPAGDTKHVYFGYGRLGYRFDGGICPVYESETGGEIEVMLKTDTAAE